MTTVDVNIHSYSLDEVVYEQLIRDLTRSDFRAFSIQFAMDFFVPGEYDVTRSIPADRLDELHSIFDRHLDSYLVRLWDGRWWTKGDVKIPEIDQRQD